LCSFIPGPWGYTWEHLALFFVTLLHERSSTGPVLDSGSF
jgi:hypothetical protein